MADDDTSELAVAAVALVVACVALLAAVVQLIQSIYATGKGLPNLDERVMGEWAKFSGVWFKWWQLRLEVDFEAPVIFLAPARNTRGPVKDADIWYARGCPKSFKDFGVKDSNDDDQSPKRERVHTVDNELATWVTLLEAIQKMEKLSRRWEDKQWLDSRTRNSQVTRPELKEHTITLAVGMQRKKRSFDAVPTVKRPYATTTICHLVELAAVLGLYWKEFNRDQNKYRAEGNGYSLLGNRVDDFGIVFVFEKTGWASFKDTRIIPTHEVKELCFGNVPTFYRENNLDADDEWASHMIEQKSLKTLQLGSRQEIADTLSLIGCNTKTILNFQKEDPKQMTHLFPVTFEIVGMLGRTLHVKGRPFRYLPNPTSVAWNSQRFSLRRMLREFERNLSHGINGRSETHHSFTSDLQRIQALASKLQRNLPDQMDQFMPEHLDEIHGAIDETDRMLSEDSKDKSVVLDVLRRHVQEVIQAINSKVDPTNMDQLSSPILSRPSSFDDLLNVPPEKREEVLMKKYFNEIRLRVVVIGSTSGHDDHDAIEASLHIHANSPQQRKQIRDEFSQTELQQQLQQPQEITQARPGSIADSVGGQHQISDLHKSNDGDSAISPPTSQKSRFSTVGPPHPIRTNTVGLGLGSRASTIPRHNARARTWDSVESEFYEPRRSDIWCTLVFRMLCWLLLHDFDKHDVQLSKSELMGSRLPVYVM
ncbi:hypothetical protein BKA67DRAFT_360231 [Truncatella angustata]|uniref:Modin n=1 Tax=Truncatella angustata TaxID=152316 RepID=A0A9P8UE82_9PEZI|nr:uncharacterized protein BKA67DRAFT_360231 [Truncatella angustata]KAH6648317.1 hypothetical protein BKA67DRAFT_360231 [Truncatella angustata]